MADMMKKIPVREQDAKNAHVISKKYVLAIMPMKQ